MGIPVVTRECTPRACRNSRKPTAILLFTASDLASITSPTHHWVLFLLWLHPFILSGVISPLISSSRLGTYRPGEFLFQYPIILPFHAVHGIFKARILKWFATSPVDHILSDLSTMTRPSWVAPHGMAYFHWVRQGCGPVIRLASFLWLWFQCFCPLMPSRNTYPLTWVSLTSDVGYLFTAAPAKHSRCSLPWVRGISSRPPLLTLNVE